VKLADVHTRVMSPATPIVKFGFEEFTLKDGMIGLEIVTAIEVSSITLPSVASIYTLYMLAGRLISFLESVKGLDKGIVFPPFNSHNLLQSSLVLKLILIGVKLAEVHLISTPPKTPTVRFGFGELILNVDGIKSTFIEFFVIPSSPEIVTVTFSSRSS
jgi:hypothetical protein